MKIFFALILLFWSLVTGAQTFETTPTFPKADQSLTLIVNASGTSLEGYSNDVWLWTWLPDCSSGCDAPTNVNPATAAQSSAKMTRTGSDPNVYTITFTPTSFFNKSKEEITKIGFKLKSVDWNDNIQTDIDLFIEISTGELEVVFSTPSDENIIVDTNQLITIRAQASQNSNLTLSIGGSIVSSINDGTSIDYDHTVSELSGSVDVLVTADDGVSQVQDGFSYLIRENTVLEARPAGIIDGINYDINDHTKVTLSLLAPERTSVYVVGDFTDWAIDPDYQMKLDGEHFWIEITGLVSGQEYGFQYLVDEEIWIADPFSDKVLDPDDQWIPSSTYPGLLTYPSEALHDKWEFNRVSILQTNQTPFNWTTTNFEKPQKEDLIVYELLVRDFLGEENMNYQSLIDTLDYIDGLGVNAIELMPIMEFNGNDSWGYNPTHMFAVDKAYGTKNDLKEFIDAAHGRGIAVILDMVMNQNNKPAPYLLMDYDYANERPNPTNKWFNVEAKHPFNVFYDINHESSYTQNWLDSINYYWLNEFRFDGYRFDLSKGFTQRFNTDVGLWGNYDISRINILKRMSDQIWSHSPDAYVILEHFADNAEEKELADYGMMLWGNAHHDYKEANIGFASGKSISWSYFDNRGWDNNYLISYMESHDEERQMYELKNFGASSGSYDIKEMTTALDRLKMSAAFFFMTPGPKMFWQFGEFGYDISIDENGRTGRKPTKWEYLNDPERVKLLKVYQELIDLRFKYNVFNQGDFSWSPNGSLKSIHINNSDTSVVLIGNYGLEDAEIEPAFTSTGIWYDFFENRGFEVADVNTPILLEPGEFHIYTNKELHAPESGLLGIVTDINNEIENGIRIYPNPVHDEMYIKVNGIKSVNDFKLFDMLGREQNVNVKWLNIAGSELLVHLEFLNPGFYILAFDFGAESKVYKIIKK